MDILPTTFLHSLSGNSRPCRQAVSRQMLNWKTHSYIYLYILIRWFVPSKKAREYSCNTFAIENENAPYTNCLLLPNAHAAMQRNIISQSKQLLCVLLSFLQVAFFIWEPYFILPIRKKASIYWLILSFLSKNVTPHVRSQLILLKCKSRCNIPINHRRSFPSFLPGMSIWIIFLKNSFNETTVPLTTT